jgi:hypothetical protein
MPWKSLPLAFVAVAVVSALTSSEHRAQTRQRGELNP